MCDYVQVVSAPHNFNSTLLCNKQTIDLLKPENDSLILGYTYSTFTETTSKISSSISSIPIIQATVNKFNNKLTLLDSVVSDTREDASNALNSYNEVNNELGQVTGDLEIIAGVVTDNARNISTNASNISTNASNIAKNAEDVAKNIEDIATINTKLDEHTTSITDILARLVIL